MSLINREAVLEYLEKRRTYELMDGRNKAYGKGIRDAMKDIESQPAVDAVPVVHGKWEDNGNDTVSCSHCATWFQKERKPYLRFCGYCGAKMDLEG